VTAVTHQHQGHLALGLERSPLVVVEAGGHLVDGPHRIQRRQHQPVDDATPLGQDADDAIRHVAVFVPPRQARARR
jgi:hypothetical protein